MKFMKQSFIPLLVSCSLVAVVNSPSFAVGSGGYENQLPSARAAGRANSVVASIDDASAVFFNPARLTAVNGGDVSAGLTLQSVKTKFEGDSGQNASSDNGTGVTPNFHVAHNFGLEKWAFGFGVDVPFGLSSNWDESGPLRYNTTNSKLVVLSMGPAAAFKPNEQWSIGVGINYLSIPNVELNNKLNTTNLNFALSSGADNNAVPDANQKLKGDGSSWGANLGVSYAPTPQHLIGVSYKTKTAIKIDGNLEFSGLSNTLAGIFGGSDYSTGAHSKVQIPAVLMMGYAWRPNEKFVLELDGQWDQWSVFKDQNVRYDETDPTRLSVLNSGNPIAKDWKNSWSVGLGSEYWINNLALRGGLAFFDSPIPNSTFEASTPDSDLYVVSLGVGQVFQNGITWDFSPQFYFVNDRHISNNYTGGDVVANGNGTYKSSAQYYSFNVGYKFGKKS